MFFFINFKIGNPDDYLKMGNHKRDTNLLSEVSTKRNKIEEAKVPENQLKTNDDIQPKKKIEIETLQPVNTESQIPENNQTPSKFFKNVENDSPSISFDPQKKSFQVSASPPNSMYEFEIIWKNVQGDLNCTFQLLRVIFFLHYL